MPEEYAKTIEHVEYDHEFGRYYRQRLIKPFVAVLFAFLSFGLDSWISHLAGKPPGLGTEIGFCLVAIAFFGAFVQELRIKGSYHCARCDKKLPFSEPADDNEIRYHCFTCGIEYRVRTDGNYDIQVPENDTD